MTVLGKILVFVVLLLSLIWNALVVNAYVTRANWKSELDRANTKLREYAEAANAERQRADRVREAADAVISQLRSDISRLRSSEQLLQENLDDARKKLETVQKTEEATQTRDVQALANAKRTQDQVDILQRQFDAAEKKANDALIAEQKAKNDALQARIEADAAKRRADDLEARLLKLSDPNRGSGGVGAIRPQVDRDFRATVLSVEGDSVVISLGANARLQKNAVLQISRYKPEPKFVGSITITSVDPFYAVGRFTPPANVVKPGPSDRPLPGDLVSVIGDN